FQHEEITHTLLHRKVPLLHVRDRTVRIDLEEAQWPDAGPIAGDRREESGQRPGGYRGCVGRSGFIHDKRRIALGWACSLIGVFENIEDSIAGPHHQPVQWLPCRTEAGREIVEV